VPVPAHPFFQKMAHLHEALAHEPTAQRFFALVLVASESDWFNGLAGGDRDAWLAHVIGCEVSSVERARMIVGAAVDAHNTLASAASSAD